MSLEHLLKDSKNPLILGHQNADPDAVCSMIAFARLYKTLNPDGTPQLAADDTSRLSNQVLRIFEPEMKVSRTPESGHDLLILLDTNSRFQLGPTLQNITENPSKTIVIDHHEPNPKIDQIAEHQIVREDKSSTCEIMVKIYSDLGVKIDANTANLLLTGMIFDTRRFFYADSETLAAAIELIEAGAEYEKCVRSLLIRPDRSERIARLKAAGRVKVHLIGDWILATSKINAYEASACRGLIDLGADVAIVGGSPAKDIVRFSSRSTRDFFEKTGVSLGSDVMEQLGQIIEGEGGGHANAAGANGKKNFEKAMSRSVELIKGAVEEKTSSDGSST
ncbi:MAG: DHH family phosphoesterase [Candidatus Thorarchaeota archaeon]|nr:DHH family phosphoesterase [Candidatus Thorarchaeota archaeon]